MNMVNLLLALFLLAAIAPFVNIQSRKITGWLLSLLPLAVFGYFISQIPAVASGEVIYERFSWVPYIGLNFSLQLDGLSQIFALLVSGIGAFILIYAGYYMQSYQNTNRFFAYLVFFLASMLGLVLSSNLITIFVFWEFTSISSFLLIGFFHEKLDSRNASLQALLVTGLGGLALLAGFILLSIPYGTFELAEIMANPGILQESKLFVPILVLILIGAFTKSAMFPFHFWLPQAMAGPSPVSAFLHSATMVKAGVFLVARLNPLMDWSELWFYSLTIFGSVTMFVGAWLSIAQSDIKKILAYTTVSALGTLVLLIGINTKYALNAFVIFLIVHAFYKATLFMMAGTIDKKTGTRNINELGGLFAYMPIAGTIMVVALLSMAGLPPMLGFIGKELIYEAAVTAGRVVPVVLVLAFLTNTFLVFVSIRLALDIFWGKTPTYKKQPAEPSLALLIGPAFLVALSLVLGLFPAVMEGRILIPTLQSISPAPEYIHLKVWHGFNLVLLLSAITVASGVLMYIFKKKVLNVVEKLNFRYFKAEFSEKFLGFIAAFLKFGKKNTALTQHGYLRFYLITIFLATSAVIFFMFMRDPVSIDFNNLQEVPIFMYFVSLMIIVATIATVSAKSRLISLIGIGIVGFGITTVFVYYSGLDVAITMVMVETLMVILGTLIIYHLPEYKPFSTRMTRLRDGIVGLMVGLMMVVLVLKSGTSTPVEKISDWLSLNSYPMAHGKNIVNVILVDFRALDTLGEITVLALAAIGIFALLKVKLKTGE